MGRTEQQARRIAELALDRAMTELRSGRATAGDYPPMDTYPDPFVSVEDGVVTATCSYTVEVEGRDPASGEVFVEVVEDAVDVSERL